MSETIEFPEGAVAYKYEDPTEGARFIFEQSEAEAVAAEDPSLIVWADEAE